MRPSKATHSGQLNRLFCINNGQIAAIPLTACYPSGVARFRHVTGISSRGSTAPDLPSKCPDLVSAHEVAVGQCTRHWAGLGTEFQRQVGLTTARIFHASCYWADTFLHHLLVFIFVRNPVATANRTHAITPPPKPNLDHDTYALKVCAEPVAQPTFKFITTTLSKTWTSQLLRRWMPSRPSSGACCRFTSTTWTAPCPTSSTDGCRLACCWRCS